MENAKNMFANRLRDAMKAAGYEPKPAVLEREFNTRYWGKPMTLHGVRRWLRGETLPTHEKLLVLAEWLGVPPQQLNFGDEIQRKVEQRRSRWDSGIGYQDRDIFEAFLKLPIPQRKLIREVILTFAKVHASGTDAGADPLSKTAPR
ncbi:MAG: XRE family transcriptional regulator [Gammaproteobacteria bacterium]|jgi:transcriptional regulator with XRE-family HTH domain|uniref:XRE family transcriptional regulator n=1 Tax=Acidovorax sp. JG5 TaxID=2822718 RepID=UPI001B340CDA|nr:XRE family transcriptional regulator [Acidovorax sp. JG5]MBP3981370.1 XRE family transcriptional regulator [Acidovorax sp. JG5]MBU4424406.1 XRE family transcriptional regulator [Gammaproteobacteria bacterium]